MSGKGWRGLHQVGCDRCGLAAVWFHPKHGLRCGPHAVEDAGGGAKCTLRAIEFLRKAGIEGVTADMLGGHLWPVRKGRGFSSGGGGDYAAQMLLGRLRSRGLVQTVSSDGSSRWSLTKQGEDYEEKP